MRLVGSGRCGLAALVMLALGGCSTSHPGFGADDITRVDDTKGVPTYSAFGHLEYKGNAQKAAAQFINAACPMGSPVLLSGQAMDIKGVDINRFDTAGTSWIVIFTCNQPIAIPPG